MKKLIAGALAVILALGAAGVSLAAGVEHDIVQSPVFLKTDGTVKKISFDNLNWTEYSGEVVITQEGVYLATNAIKVLSGEHTVVLKGVRIYDSAGSAFDIATGASANIKLSGNNYLYGYGVGNDLTHAALRVPQGASVSITGMDGESDKLVVYGSGGGAGIGGNTGEACGTVSINNCAIGANSSGGAAIGGGDGSNGTGVISINNSHIEATGGMSIFGTEPSLSYPIGYSWRTSVFGDYTLSYQAPYVWSAQQDYAELIPVRQPEPIDFSSFITYTYEDWLREQERPEMAPSSGLEPDVDTTAGAAWAAPATEPVTSPEPLAQTADISAAAGEMPPQTADSATLLGFIMLAGAMAAAAGAVLRGKGLPARKKRGGVKG